MRLFNSLPVKNISRRPFRSSALILLSFLLCFLITGGSLIIYGLQSGLHSLQSRLGADLMVVPYEATTKADIGNIVLQGNTGYFYMDKKKLEEIRNLEGVGKISAQFFLASCSASCCSTKVQIIGIDPQTDFTIQPWIEKSYGKNPAYLEILVGNSLNAFAGDTMTFYGTKVKVVGKLAKTGTYLDTSVFCGPDTIRTLITAAKERKMFDFGNLDPNKIVSCIMVDTADGYSVDEVMNEINLHVRKVRAIRTAEMIANVSDQLEGTSSIATALTVAVWILSLIILSLAYTMMTRERRKEFALLRVMGASGKMLSGILLIESFLLSAVGSVMGAILAVGMSEAFSALIEESMKMPFLLPEGFRLIALVLGTTLLSIGAGALSSAFSAAKTSKIDAALTLRSE